MAGVVFGLIGVAIFAVTVLTYRRKRNTGMADGQVEQDRAASRKMAKVMLLASLPFLALALALWLVHRSG